MLDYYGAPYHIDANIAIAITAVVVTFLAVVVDAVVVVVDDDGAGGGCGGVDEIAFAIFKVLAPPSFK